MDDNVPPNNTLLVVDALIKANKDFDLLMIPNAAHGYGAASQYMTRRRWDYFVRYLADAIPPPEYEMKPYARDARCSCQWAGVKSYLRNRNVSRNRTSLKFSSFRAFRAS